MLLARWLFASLDVTVRSAVLARSPRVLAENNSRNKRLPCAKPRLVGRSGGAAPFPLRMARPLRRWRRTERHAPSRNLRRPTHTPRARAR